MIWAGFATALPYCHPHISVKSVALTIVCLQGENVCANPGWKYSAAYYHFQLSIVRSEAHMVCKNRSWGYRFLVPTSRTPQGTRDRLSAGEFPLEMKLMQHLCHAKKIRSQLSTQLIWCTFSVLTCQEEQQLIENRVLCYLKFKPPSSFKKNLWKAHSKWKLQQWVSVKPSRPMKMLAMQISYCNQWV